MCAQAFESPAGATRGCLSMPRLLDFQMGLRAGVWIPSWGCVHDFWQMYEGPCSSERGKSAFWQSRAQFGASLKSLFFPKECLHLRVVTVLPESGYSSFLDLSVQAVAIFRANLQNFVMPTVKSTL